MALDSLIGVQPTCALGHPIECRETLSKPHPLNLWKHHTITTYHPTEPCEKPTTLNLYQKLLAIKYEKESFDGVLAERQMLKAKARRLDEVVEECGSFLANEETEFQAGIFLNRILCVAQGESEVNDE